MHDAILSRMTSSAVAALLLAAVPLDATQVAHAQPATATWRNVDRVVAFADVHGAYTELSRLLRDAGIVDATMHWGAGKTHVVSLGDLLDRGDDSRKVMDLLMRLQPEAAAAGGQLHVVLGNHEAMNLLGDLRYVTPGEYSAYADLEPPEVRAKAREQWVQANGANSGAAFDTKFPAGYFGHRVAFAPNGQYGKWLLGLPVAIVVNDTLFMHGGPSPVLAGQNLDAVNLRYRTALTDYLGALSPLQSAGLVLESDAYNDRPARAAERAVSITDPGQQATVSAAVASFKKADESGWIGMDGPNWYRGASMCNEVAEADVLYPLLQQFGVARLVVGHTPTRDRSAVSRFGGTVIKLDAGMNTAAYKGRAAALILEHGKVSVRYPGDAAASEVKPEGLYVGPSTVSDDTVAAMLANGTVSVTGPGSPGRLLVAVEQNGRSIPAVFVAGNAAANRKELAAYKLDRMLGLGIVPAVTEREVQGQKGTLQARPSKSVTQGDVQRQSLRAGGWCPLEPQFQLVYAFDALTGNEARTAETLLFDAEEWFALATAFDGAFGTGKDLPAYLKARPPTPGAELRKRLQALDANTLKTGLGTLLDERAVKALLGRRDLLLTLPMPATAAR